jgi:hypothetical protein
MTLCGSFSIPVRKAKAGPSARTLITSESGRPKPTLQRERDGALPSVDAEACSKTGRCLRISRSNRAMVGLNQQQLVPTVQDDRIEVCGRASGRGNLPGTSTVRIFRIGARY